MLEPNGPLPPEIYWRRRALAIGAAVIALALIIWAASALFGGGSDTPEANSAATSSSLTTDVSFTPNPSGSNAPDGNGGSGGGAAGGSGGSGTQASGSSTSASSSSTTGAPVPAGQCADSSLAVKATADKATFAPGEEPSFTIVITNIGSAPCDRDLAGGLQQVLVYSIDGKTRLWSNVDCYPQPAADVRNLAPGEQAAFKVAWSATTSTPECATAQNPERNPVGAGAYTVVGQLGALRSSPEPFNIA
ncbi:hypothetical protein M2405_001442 [Rhodococcus erythropolis]|uniref:DUF4232 domain-containing protein n=1 Tax=Rhodococcus erythropolis TaxID=1833 RepID=UPI002166DBBE|nr:DUF4232 domain-containing protein [Rhodococcus erythropolis]MCS4253166.1 hypothetical protein [Rhodococcus erythropolis]MCW2428385.1 hypothetical protein [Rhodococcus erythropolis]